MIKVLAFASRKQDKSCRPEINDRRADARWRTKMSYFKPVEKSGICNLHKNNVLQHGTVIALAAEKQ